MWIYKITNIQNNKVYIGQTIRPIEKRFQRHLNDALNNIIDTHFARAIRKYGKENFLIEEIDSATTQEELDEKEVYWINFFDSVNSGYNSNANKGRVGGDTLTNHPDLVAIRKKISESKMGDKNPRARQVKAINILTKEEIVFGSACECARKLNFTNHACISKRALGQIKSPYQKQWLFEYID